MFLHKNKNICQEKIKIEIENYKKAMTNLFAEQETFLTETELDAEHFKWKNFILENLTKNENGIKRRKWRKNEREEFIEGIEKEFKNIQEMNELRRKIWEEKEKCGQLKATIEILLGELVKAKWEMEKESKINGIQEQIERNKQTQKIAMEKIGELKRKIENDEKMRQISNYDNNSKPIRNSSITMVQPSANIKWHHQIIGPPFLRINRIFRRLIRKKD